MNYTLINYRNGLPSFQEPYKSTLATKPSKEKFSRAPLKVLVADDDRDYLTLLQKTLAGHGFWVIASLNGENLGQLVNDENPDIILLDIHMGNVDGSDLCLYLKSSGLSGKAPVILISANEDLDKIARICAADSFLSKPFNADELIQKIDAFLSK